MSFFFRRTDPVELRPIKLYLGAPDQLIEVKRRIDRAEGQTVGLGNAINIIGADDVTGAGHILDNDRRIARDMLAEVTRREAPPKIIAAAGGRRDHQRDRFALIEGRLGRQRSAVENSNNGG